ncbi:MAG: c-type cytochrome domain-containing protein [Cyclobacteriaceae bacterium]
MTDFFYIRLRPLAGKVLAVMLVVTGACVHDPFLDPNSLNDGKPSIPGCTDAGEVCFETNVLPIFISACARPGCHDLQSHKEGYNLSSYATIVRKGIKPGDAQKSKLYKVLFDTGEDQMPPDSPLPANQRDSIAAWINQGARNTTHCACYCDSTQVTFSQQIRPILDKACVGCHKLTELNGDVDLTDYFHVKEVVQEGSFQGSIKHEVGYVAMPPGTKLSPCEIRLVELWIENGAPND